MQSLAPILSLKWLTKDKIGRILRYIRYTILLVCFVALVFIFVSIFQAAIEYQTFKSKLSRISNPKIAQTEVTELRDVNASAVAAKLNLSEPSIEKVQEKESVAPPDLRLVGTIVLEGLPRIAIIENKGATAPNSGSSFGAPPLYGGAPGKTMTSSQLGPNSGKGQESFAIGDSVFEFGTLKTIKSQRVEIMGSSGLIVLKIEDMPDVPDSGSNSDAKRMVVDATELDQALENLPLLLSQARAVPYFKEGKAIGLRLFAIRSGSLYEKIGLLNGDILKSVNGKSLGDFREAVTLFDKLKEEKSLSLEMERNLKPLTINYSIR